MGIVDLSPFRSARARAGGCFVGLLLVSARVTAAEDPFAANVRPTEPRSAAEQLATLQGPPGFQVQLVVSEPDIHKPMNLAFDSLGRLWVTTSREYPRPAPPDRPGRDRVMIFEDFAADGRARKATTFADGLNIPIGVYPFRSTEADGRPTWKAVVWSIPHIWLMEDRDGDGRADHRERLYGPFDHTRDTHGNQASFRRGFDGWLYATHGFNNDSRVAGRDGNQVHLNSGNTYRIRLDGSRIEHHTWGQVNPFGLAWDPQGNLYSSDCHSEPIYLLLAGGYYPSFGKPHDGLGFAPNMMEQIRGSTAIDGISYYADDLWPAEYLDSVFVGDVMTSRVYRDHAAPRGSGRVARPRPDFLVSTDPWFRPVDTLLGPDGALYVADFYNRIIGHYEVPLDHPGRDRERGRIWRVVYRGESAEPRLRAPALATSREGLVAELGSGSLARRLLAMNEIADRFGTGALGAVREAVNRPANPFQRVHGLWLLHRLGGLTVPDLSEAASAVEPLVRIHAMRILADLRGSAAAGRTLAPGWQETAWRLAIRGLDDADPVVRRGAAEALGRGPEAESLRPLLDLRARVPEDDSHLRFTVRQAIRNLLAAREVPGFGGEGGGWSARDLGFLLDIAPAVKTPPAAAFLLRHHERYAADAEFSRTALAHVARFGSLADLERLVAVARGLGGSAADLEGRVDLFRGVEQGFRQRGIRLTDAARAWGGELARGLLESVEDSTAWRSVPVEGTSNPANPWDWQRRPCDDGQSASLLSSHPRGESLTGRLRSRPFAAPDRLRFYLAGHDGEPGLPAGRRNWVRLLDSVSGEVLRETPPPRRDTAVLITWDLAEWVGRPVVLEVMDGDAGPSYAWLAIGRIEPAVAALPAVAPAVVVSRLTAGAEVAAASEARELAPLLQTLARRPDLDPAARAAAARAFSTYPLIRAVADLAGDPAQPFAWRERLADVLFSEDTAGQEPLIEAVWRDAPRRFQVAFAGLSASRRELTSELLRRMAEGRAPAGLLQDRRLRERLSQSADEPARLTLERLVGALPAEDPSVQRLLEERRAGFGSAKVDPERGREVFRAACLACHQVGGEGGLVGPQLTGIGTRGVERLCEDILAPNRNVDHAFWTTVLVLKDGETETGLFRREEGELLVLANSAGTEFTVPKSSVAERRESNLSVMPTNFGEALRADDFYHLLAFLLQTSTPR